MRSSDPFSELIRSIEENLQREQGDDDWIPPGDEPPRRNGGNDNEGGDGQINPRRWLWWLIPLLIFFSFNRILSFFTDLVWYDSLGLAAVFRTRIFAALTLFAGGAILFWLFLAVNVWLAQRIEAKSMEPSPIQNILDGFGVRLLPTILTVGALFAFFMGLSLSSMWEDVLLYLNQIDFNLMDPIFNRDVSFFIFTLPIWQTARGWLLTMAIITLLAVLGIYGVGWRGRKAPTPILAHVSILGALILLLIAWQYRLNAFGLVYSSRGAVFGAGYTDVRAQLPAYNILSIITLITAVLVIVTAFLRRAWRAIVVLLAVWLGVAILFGSVYPGFIQRFQVNPNELNLEEPYIANNIRFTRLAFELDDISVQPYNASEELTAETLLTEPETVRNIRLWDYRPLLQTYNQVQALRQYYEFNDIDIDRYAINGETRQVMLAARELAPERLDENAQTWVNQRLVYTHGYGVAASPVAQVTRDGLPEFYLQDLPPRGVIDVTRPQIYFGERTDSYVIARTNEPEFDYPRGEGNVTTQFDADTGINMSLWHRLLFALRFADINILLNQDINGDSQLLWRRVITERIDEVAPFLRYDSDPYIVVSDTGELFWFLDAYTVSSRFPYSEPYSTFNYIRNPVKVVTNAYSGEMLFYVIDPAEPIAAAYAKIFPDLFRPYADMPADLRDHIRYPNDIFSVQAEMYRTYHMTDVTEFYNKEDVWAWPEEIFDNEPVRIEPYYVLMSLPGSDDLDFIQILPFTPANRENMIAWLATQNDPDKYGEKVVYEFGKDSLFFGPQQIEARIDQDPTISSQLSLWNQQGSNVIRGNLLVIPVADSLLYVEPLYLQAANGKIPELKRVIVATAQEAIMAENLGLALADLFGSDVIAEAGLEELLTAGSTLPAVAGDGASGGRSDTTLDQAELAAASVDELILLANQQYADAQDYLRLGDWTNYGRRMSALEATLTQLAEVTGVETAPAEETPPAQDNAAPAEETPEGG
ncbi:MAG: UPF0182 family protein [Caldilineaceae bacterium]|nr:UPF0182 family protein [Caldilineaceae bacterium]